MWKLAFAATLASTGAMALELTSPDFAPNGVLANAFVYPAYGCTGKNISPALNWSDAPAGTKSFALMAHDPAAPTAGGFWHWVVFDIPASVNALAQGAGDVEAARAPKGAVQSRSSFGGAGYGGPCPPLGDPPHPYHFMLFALDVAKLGPDVYATPALVETALRKHVLAKADLTGRYGR